MRDDKPEQGIALTAAKMVTVAPGEGRLAHAPEDHPSVKPAKIGVLLANRLANRPTIAERLGATEVAEPLRSGAIARLGRISG